MLICFVILGLAFHFHLCILQYKYYICFIGKYHAGVMLPSYLITVSYFVIFWVHMQRQICAMPGYENCIALYLRNIMIDTLKLSCVDIDRD